MRGYGLIALAATVYCLSAAGVNAQVNYQEFLKIAPEISIPDFSTQTGPGTVIVPMNVPVGTPRVIVDMKISTLVSHSWQGDLRFTLFTPWNSAIVLTDRPGHPQSTFGFSADNFGHPGKGHLFTWSDTGLRRYDYPWVNQPGIHNPTGEWIPEQSLNDAVRGFSPVGEWRFMVQDFAAGEKGFLHLIDVQFTVVPEPASLFVLGAGLAGFLKRRSSRTRAET